MPNTPQKPQLHAKETLRIFWRASIRHRSQSWFSLLLPISNVLLGVGAPYFASKVLAGLVTHSQAWSYLIWFVVIAILGFLGNTIGLRMFLRLQATVTQELNDTMFERLLARSVGFYNNQIGGKLVSDAIEFPMAYIQLTNGGFVTGIGFALTIVVGLIVVIISNWAIGLSLAVLLTMLTFWTIRASMRRSGMRNKRMMTNKRLISHLSDSIVNAVTVKMFAREQDEIATNRKISKKLAAIRVADWQRSVTSENQRMSVLLLMQATLLFTLIVLTAKRPHLLAAGIFAFTYTLTLINRFFTVSTTVRQIEEGFLQAAPMVEILQQPIEITDTAGATELIVEHGEIVCQNVAFHYADASDSDMVFTDLNLHIRPGEKIGLVGHSGGGKSTLTRLLLRFDDITGGSISIDGQDIREVTQTSLRQQIAYVPQEPLLFHRTIRENIIYGNENASQEQLENATKLAYAHDFIMKLPEGYDTVVGERGVKLSGGQRQRVAIARAILKNAPILVLDEATSALDSESEKVIQKALWKLMDDKTTVVVAHRLSTIQKMDRIIVIDEGKIVEDGSHTELLERNGTYAKLWTHQSGGFIEE